jgi:hypothetical protein
MVEAVDVTIYVVDPAVHAVDASGEASLEAFEIKEQVPLTS